MFYEYILSFGIFFATAVVVLGIFLYLYALVTPYDDYEMIFVSRNTASALGLGGATIGVSIPLYSALSYSISYDDFALWAVVAIAVQLTFAAVVTRLGGRFSFKTHIMEGNVAAASIMALLSIAVGILNAGSMSY